MSAYLHEVGLFRVHASVHVDHIVYVRGVVSNQHQCATPEVHIQYLIKYANKHK